MFRFSYEEDKLKAELFSKNLKKSEKNVNWS